LGGFVSKIRFFGFLYLCLIVVSSNGFSAQVSKEGIEAAILGTQSFSEEILNEMDVNADSKVDVGDLIRFLNRNNTPIFYGYQWLVTASFQPAQGNSVPLNYSFVLNINPSPASPVVGSLSDFDPTRSVLRQGTPQSYVLTRLIPEGSTFSLSEAGDNVTLQSAPVSVAANNPINPTAKALTKTWSLVIHKSSLQTGNPVNGTITQSVVGLLPNAQAIQMTGSIFMTPLNKL
jgi:hypothetical protein